ncbi:hypothetical protein GOC15_22755 [Sinorhizobium meliloti]|nr:hypothetical protein [Sinorhizobium meliloti]
MAATEFNDSAHWGFFMTGLTLTSSTGKYIRVSELALAALRAQGVFDNMIDGTTAPATDKLWLDKNADPAVLKEWDPTGAAWVPMTFERLFGRAIVTPLATPTGTANALVVAQPTPFIRNRMYSLTPVLDNTGPATIQVTGVGTYAVKYTDGTDVEAQEFKTGNPTILLFTGSRFEVVFKVADIYAASDAAIAAKEEAEAIAALMNNAYRRGQEEVWVTDPAFGGLSLGPTDDWTPVIRAAVDAAVAADRRIVYFPPRTYLLKTSLTLNTADGMVMLRGAGRTERGAKIVVGFDGPGFLLRGTLPYITGLMFQGDKTTYPNSRAIKSAKTANTDDMDMFAELNAFNTFPLAIEHVGRGFICRNNDFAICNKDIDVSWPTSGVEGDGLHILPNGFRKWIITANHSHSSGGFLTTSGTDSDDFRGAVIANNLQDIGRQFFSGGIRDSAIVGNVAENCNSTPIYINAGGNNMTIVGNKLGGMENNDDVSIHRPGAAVWFDTGSTVQGLTLTGNVFAYVDSSAVQFSNDLVESTVVGNTFRDYNKNAGASDAGLEVVGNIIRCTISANAFDENPAVGACPIRVGGQVQGSYVLGNAWNNSVALVNAVGGIDSGSMVERKAGEFLGRFAFVGSKDVLLKAISSFDGTWTADEVMGGFAVQTEDISGGGAGVAGAFRQLVTTSTGAGTYWRVSISTTSTRDVAILDINSVGLMPVTTNATDLGSSTVRFRTGYFQSVNLNGISLVTSAGTPEGVVTAPVGSWCSDTTNGVTYVKKTGTGNTGWKLVTQAA